MRSLFGLLVVALVFIVGAVWVFPRMRATPLVAPGVTAKASGHNPTYAEAKEASQAVTMAGPLADYMAKQDGTNASADAKDVETIPWVPTPSDHVGGSVVGTTIPILHKKFGVRSAVQIAFELPAHAATPRLRGTFQSSAKPGGEADAPVEILVLNEEQYSDFVTRHSGDATFAAEEAPAGEVNASLPPTINQPARYHLVFRNDSRAEGRKFVQADFRVEF
jgi:hypothetical protein